MSESTAAFLFGLVVMIAFFGVMAWIKLLNERINLLHRRISLVTKWNELEDPLAGEYLNGKNVIKFPAPMSEGKA